MHLESQAPPSLRNNTLAECGSLFSLSRPPRSLALRRRCPPLTPLRVSCRPPSCSLSRRRTHFFAFCSPPPLPPGKVTQLPRMGPTPGTARAVSPSIYPRPVGYDGGTPGSPPPATPPTCGDSGGRTRSNTPCKNRAGAGGRCHVHSEPSPSRGGATPGGQAEDALGEDGDRGGGSSRPTPEVKYPATYHPARRPMCALASG